MHARSGCSTGWKFCRLIQGCRLCLFSLSPPFVPLPSLSSSIFSPLCPCLSSPSIFLRPPSILATPSYNIYPRAFFIQQRPQQTNIFVRMIRDTMPDDGISTIKGLQKSSADTCYVCSWCSVKVRTSRTITSVLRRPKIIRRRFAIKIKPLLCDITNSNILISQITFCDINK